MRWFNITIIALIVVGGLITLIDPISKDEVIVLERDHFFELILRGK